MFTGLGKAEVSFPRLHSRGELEFGQRMAAIHGGVCNGIWCAAQGSRRPVLITERDSNPTRLVQTGRGVGPVPSECLGTLARAWPAGKSQGLHVHWVCRYWRQPRAGPARWAPGAESGVGAGRAPRSSAGRRWAGGRVSRLPRALSLATIVLQRLPRTTGIIVLPSPQSLLRENKMIKYRSL